MEDRVEKLMEDIKGLDEKVEESGLSDLEILGRKDKFCELWRFLNAKYVKMVQMSRSKWLKEGDANSKINKL